MTIQQSNRTGEGLRCIGDEKMVVKKWLENMRWIIGKDSYPLYRRREDGRKEMVRKHEMDNRWVVSYNPYLL
jgi:hypothetical protein